MTNGIFVPGRRVRAAPVVAALLLAGLAPALVQAQPPAPGEKSSGQTGPVGTQAIDAYIGGKAMQVLFMRRMDLGEFGTNPVRAGFFIDESRDLIGLGDLLVSVGNKPEALRHWSLRVGTRVYAALLSEQNQDIFAAAIGGSIRYFMGQNHKTSVGGSAFYAPDITTFGTADSVSDVSLRFETPLTPNTDVYVGYRWFRFNLVAAPGINASDRRVDEDLHVGVVYHF